MPGVPTKTLEMLGFFALILVGIRARDQRFVGRDATAAGFLPIAAGYLIAHYLTYLLIDGQHIVVAISDPLQRGWDLFGHRVLPGRRRRGCRRASCGPCSWRRSSAATCSGRGPATSSRRWTRRGT